MNPELVNQITKQVLDALKAHGIAAAPKPSSPRANRPAATVPAAASAQPATRCFLTADMLHRRIGQSSNQILELAAHEFLTPSAADLAMLRKMTIRRAPAPPTISPPANPASAAAKPSPAAAPYSAPTSAPQILSAVGIVSGRNDDLTPAVVRGLIPQDAQLMSFNQDKCSISNTRGLCRAITEGVIQLGILVAPNPADAMLLSAKHRDIFPVLAHNARMVESAVRHFGANLLVVEQNALTWHELRTALSVFLANRPAASAAHLLAAVEDVQRKGE